jgi:hypothetical protein
VLARLASSCSCQSRVRVGQEWGFIQRSLSAVRAMHERETREDYSPSHKCTGMPASWEDAWDGMLSYVRKQRHMHIGTQVVIGAGFYKASTQYRRARALGRAREIEVVVGIGCWLPLIRTPCSLKSQCVEVPQSCLCLVLVRAFTWSPDRTASFRSTVVVNVVVLSARQNSRA